MATAKKKTVKAAPKGAASASQRDVVAAKNISGHTINTSKGAIPVGEKGECTIAELRQFNKYLERTS